jgi:hypothetical protein
VKDTIPSAFYACIRYSLGSMALNAMITDLVNLAVWILENIIDASKYKLNQEGRYEKVDR